MVVYTDSTYKFRVDHPGDFVVRSQPAEKLAQLTPRPVSVVRLMKPALASSDLGDLEAADMEIRVYAVGQGAELEGWLRSNGLLPDEGSSAKPFGTGNVSGVEVCASTLIAPGCSYFVLGSGHVYQLTPASLEGEAMLKTFTLLS